MKWKSYICKKRKFIYLRKLIRAPIKRGNDILLYFLGWKNLIRIKKRSVFAIFNKSIE